MIDNLKPIIYVAYKVRNVTKIKDKYGFRVILTLEDGNEQTIQHSGYEKKEIAEQEKYKIIAQLVNNTYVAYKMITVKEYMEYWYENRAKKRMRTYNTKMSYRNAIFNYVIPKIGNLNLLNLSNGIVEKLYEDIMNQSKSVCQMVRTVLISSLNDAVIDKFVSSNVALGIKIPKTTEEKIKEATTESVSTYHTLVIDEQKTFTIEQIATLIKGSKGTPIYLQVLFASLMGLRKSEINAIKYTDIDFFNKKLILKTQLGRRLNDTKEDCRPKTLTKQEVQLKTKSSQRVLDIPDLVFEEILEERKKYEQRRKRRINDKHNPFFDGNYVCCSTYGKPRSKGFSLKYYNEIKKKYNLPDLEWRYIRNTYTTILAKNDFSMKAIATLLGHATEIVTFANYTDKNEIICDCLDSLESFITDIIPDNYEENIVDCTDIETDVLMQNIIIDLLVS